MGTPLPCQFCGKKTGLFGPAMFRCTSCGTVLCQGCAKQGLVSGAVEIATLGLAKHGYKCLKCGSKLREIT